MKLSEHFSYNEMTVSQTATRLVIDNNPTGIELENLKKTAIQMEVVRTVLGNRVISVSSGYRSPLLNRKIGGAKNSAHMFGYAVDFTAAGLSIADTIDIIRKSKVTYDQLINEYGRWVHISFDPRARHQCFSIT